MSIKEFWVAKYDYPLIN